MHLYITVMLVNVNADNISTASKQEEEKQTPGSPIAQ